MSVTIKAVEPKSIADKSGWKAGAQILSINYHTISDVLDFRFYASDERLMVKMRQNGMLIEQEIVNDDMKPLGVELEDFRIKHCGDDCVFCFVDQNPIGLRESLYFRDGDYRMSFLYGNYITMTNLRERDMERIVEQRLSPLYISVHCTNDEIRRKMMGHKTEDKQREKMRYLRDNGIEMHTQIVLVPDYNDKEVLAQTIRDLYDMNDAIQSVAIVPVGITEHRASLRHLRSVTPQEAADLIEEVKIWQAKYRDEIGRGFVYLSDEWYILADQDFPFEEDYDGFPLMENGVGMCRDFITEFEYQSEEFPEAFTTPKRLTMVTSTLPSPILANTVTPKLQEINGLDVNLVIAENILFGKPVTVSGLLSGKCYLHALKGQELGDMVLLPPDSLNFEGVFMDDMTPDELSQQLGGVDIQIFDGDWVATLEKLNVE